MMRATVLDRLKEDLVGPYEEEEVLLSRPSDVYLTGILWPSNTRIGAEEDDQFGLYGESESETKDGENDEISLTNLIRPCSAGVSFAAKAENGNAKLNITVRFATYDLSDVLKNQQPDDDGGRVRTQKEWKRRPYDIQRDGVALEDVPQNIDLGKYGAPLGVRLYIRTAPWSDSVLATVTLLNECARLSESKGRDDIEKLTLFQVGIEIRPGKETLLVARPSRHGGLGEDGGSADFLYRDVREFATGHTCSTEWKKENSDPNTVSMVGTDWIPSAEVPATSSVGHEVFATLRNDKKHKPLSARWLATATPDEQKEALQKLPTAYKKWIEIRETEVASLPGCFQEQATENLKICDKVRLRMIRGVEQIVDDGTMLRAFGLANLAMASQYEWDPEKKSRGSLEWRPFQLGFILLAAASVADRGHPERKVMDLLWFPTGGGKTEAYLALIAFLAFYRRLSTGDDPDKGAGVAAIMRYTLRLLTTQQFTRAAAVMLACEAIRRGRICKEGESSCELGSTPFSIGLWIGGSASPNKASDSAEALAGSPAKPTPAQIVDCPACHKRLAWTYDTRTHATHVRCKNEGCLLFCREAPLPIWTVDEDIYREKPTLLIGTIDKFAQIVRCKKINGLFGINDGSPPDLILQDELHLISGSLGTIAGLYEVAINRMFSYGDVIPKIIGSTATIQRASEQVTSLFDRQTEQFPPSGLNAEDSAFATVDRGRPGRIYASVTTAGRSAKFTLQAVASSLLQSAAGATIDDKERDLYWTLVCYFNSLRELGGAHALMHDDVDRSLGMLAERRKRGEKGVRRKLERIEELTSRRSQTEIREMLGKLEKKIDTQSATRCCPRDKHVECWGGYFPPWAHVGKWPTKGDCRIYPGDESCWTRRCSGACGGSAQQCEGSGPLAL